MYKKFYSSVVALRLCSFHFGFIHSFVLVFCMWHISRFGQIPINISFIIACCFVSIASNCFVENSMQLNLAQSQFDSYVKQKWLFMLSTFIIVIILLFLINFNWFMRMSIKVYVIHMYINLRLYICSVMMVHTIVQFMLIHKCTGHHHKPLHPINH